MSNVKELLQSFVANPENSSEEIKLLSEFLDEGDVINIDEEDVCNATKIIQTTSTASGTNELITVILRLIGDCAREEENRAKLSKEALLKLVILYLQKEEPKVSLQSIRCLCNICAENDAGKEIFSANNGVGILLAKAGEVLDKSLEDKQWKDLIVPACNCVQNMISDSDSMQERFVEQGVLSLLWKFLQTFHSSSINISTTIVTGLSQFTDNASGMETFYKEGHLKSLLDLLKECNDDMKTVLFTNLLKEWVKEEYGRTYLNKCGCILEVAEMIEGRSCFSEKDIDTLTKDMTDVVVMLTSGEESFTDLRSKDQHFLRRFSKWIESPNNHIQVSAGLALGNYARDEETCRDIVKNGIHENLINIIKEHENDENYNDRLEAFNSCLRNLCIPVENKMILIDAGLPTLAVGQVKNGSMGVQFKALAILRLLVQENLKLATFLSMDKDLIEKIVELTNVSAVSSVPSESQRLLSSLVKYSSAEEPIRFLLQYRAIDGILPLLNSEYMIMQNEGLIALIIAVANVPDCSQELKDKECVQKVLKMLSKPEVQAQTCFNGLTFLQVVLSVEGGKDHLVTNNANEVIEKLKNHPEAVVKDKAVETDDLLKTL